MTDCEATALDSDYSATWKLYVGTGGSGGGSGANANLGRFVSPLGEYTQELGEAESSNFVVYQPPRDLAAGEVRVIRVEAKIFNTPLTDDGDPVGDHNADAVDEPLFINFTVTVTRHDPSVAGNSYFDVLIQPVSIPNVDQHDPDCDPASHLCCNRHVSGDMVDGISLSPAPDQVPTFGMLVNELRPIRLVISDRDKKRVECGDFPCVSADAARYYSDKLKVEWTLDSGGGSLIWDARHDATVLYRAGATPGHVKIKYRIDDKPNDPQADDPSVPPPGIDDFIEFDVVDVHFIDQTNTALPNIVNGQGASTLGLQVSYLQPDQGINQPASATFLGPRFSDDPRTYRVEIQRADANPPVQNYSVIVRMRRAWPAVTYAGAAYSSSGFQILPDSGDPNRFRTNLHLRLVSNAIPSDESHPTFVYDDDVLGDQSVLVQLGDWIEAEIRDPSGQRVGSIELPVERPWNESTAGTDAPSPILFACAGQWFIMDGVPEPPAPVSGWSSARIRSVIRVNEDLAQAGARFAPAAGYTATALQRVPKNAIRVKGKIPAFTGSETFSFKVNGASLNPISYTSSDTSVVIAGWVRAAILALPAYTSANVVLMTCKDSGTPPASPPDYLVFINPAQNAPDVVMTWSDPDDRKVVILKPAHSSTANPTQLVTIVESGILCGNCRGGVVADGSSLNVFALRGDDPTVDADVWQDGGIAATGVADGSGGTFIGDFEAVAWAIFARSRAVDGDDSDYCQTFGHETFHFLSGLPGTAHVSPSIRLMHNNPVPGGTGQEQPDARKRLIAAERVLARTGRAGAAEAFTDDAARIPEVY